MVIDHTSHLWCRLGSWQLGMLFVLLAVAARPTILSAQDASLTGVLAARWGDPADATGNSELTWILATDRGESYDILVSEAVLESAGGIRAIDRRRVVVTGSSTNAPAALRESRPPIHASSVRLVGFAALSAGSPQFGSKSYALLLCKFNGNPDEPISLSEATTLMGNTYPNIDHYYREISNDQMNLVGSEVFGWFTLPQPQSAYMSGGSPNLNALAADCTAAADASVDFSSFDGIITQFNDNFGSSAWGGGQFLNLDGVNKGWPFTWMPLWATQTSKFGVYAHEIGHSLGLPHSSGPYSASYDSEWDVMSDSYLLYYAPASGSVAGHTIIYHKDLLGWIPTNRKKVFSGTGAETMELQQAEFPATGSNPLFLKILIPGTSAFYTVESRRFLGYDQPLPGEAVVIHRVTPGASIPAKVVDPDNNGDPNDAGAMWLPGETFNGEQGISVEVNSRTTEGWNITVRAGYTLTLAGAGTGAGSIASQGALVPTIACTVTAGVVTGACDATYDGGQMVTLTAIANSGSTFSGWTGSCTGMAPCVLSMSQARTVVATFDTSAPQCTLTLDAGSGGLVSLTNGTVTGACGRNVTVSATPESGFAFTGWSDGSTVNPYTIVLATSKTLTASFSSQCVLTVTAGVGGSAIVTGGSVSGECGRNMTVAATPDSGYLFADWSDGSTDNPYAFALTGSQTLTANFSAQCTILISANSGGTAAISSGSAAGSCGRDLTIVATPDDGFAFKDWTDGSTANPRVIQLINSQALAANFVAQCLVATSASPTSGGTTSLVNGDRSGDCGRSVTIGAVASTGYLFMRWIEAGAVLGSFSTLTIVPASDRHPTAVFESIAVLADHTADALIGEGVVSASDVMVLDSQGNHNGVLDLGDLVALLDRVPNSGLAQRALTRALGKRE